MIAGCTVNQEQEPFVHRIGLPQPVGKLQAVGR
jgi:hypothetical protein